MDTGFQKKGWAALAVWGFLTLGILLAPAPREWGAFGKWINSYYDQIRPVLQPAAHIVLMAAGVILFMRYLSHLSPRRAFLISAAMIMLFAVALELLQSVLPIRFARQCDVEDLIPSMIGMLIGGVVGICYNMNNKEEKK